MEPYVVLARRYRPRAFAEVLGQEAIAKTLVHAIETGRVAHAYLFAGPRGIGKTSMARILARALCCTAFEEPTPTPCGECDLCRAVAKGEDLDVIEIDGASNRGIDEVRTLRENARYSPARARMKIYVIDEVHMLTTEAFNALLKILEEPPSHVKFIFATTEPQKVPATILSRCQRFDFRRIPTRTIVGHLKQICDQEGVNAAEGALYALAAASTGGMRDAQSLLDQLITLGGGEVREEDLASLLGTVSGRRMEDLLRGLAGGDAEGVIRAYEDVYDQGIDPAEFLKQLIATLRDLLVLSTCGEDTDLVDLTPEAKSGLAGVAAELGQPRVLHAIGLLSETLKTVRLVGEGRALVELALVKLATTGAFRSLDEILGDLDALEKRLGGPTAPAAPAAPPPEEEAGSGLFGDARVPEGALKGEDSVRLTIGVVRDRWPELLDRVKAESSSTGSFLASGRVTGLRDDAVRVGFPPSARFQRSQLEDGDRLRTVERVLQEVHGQPLRLESEESEEAEEGDTETPGGAETPVSRDEIEQVNREPLVNALKEVFMARLVHIERT